MLHHISTVVGWGRDSSLSFSTASVCVLWRRGCVQLCVSSVRSPINDKLNSTGSRKWVNQLLLAVLPGFWKACSHLLISLGKKGKSHTWCSGWNVEVVQAATCRPLCDKSHRQYDSHQVAAAKHFSPTLLAHLITFSPAPQMSPASAFVAQSTHPPPAQWDPPHFLRYQRKIWKIQEKHWSYLLNSCSLVSLRLINVKISAVFAVINVSLVSSSFSFTTCVCSRPPTHGTQERQVDDELC